MAVDVLAALNNSGIASNWINKTNLDANVGQQSAIPKQSFMGSVGNTAASVGGMALGAIDAPIHAVQHYVEGFKNNLDINSHVAQMQAASDHLQKQDLANTQAYKSGKIQKAEYDANNVKLGKAYQELGKTQKTQAQQVQSDVSSKGYTKGAGAKDIATVGGTALAVAAPFAAPLVAGAATGGDLTATALAASRAGLNVGKLAEGTSALEVGGSRAAQVAAQASRGVAKGIDVASGAGTAPNSSIIGGAAKIVGRNTAFIQPTIQTAGQSASDAVHGNAAGAIGNAALLAAPGLISGAGKLISKLGPEISTAMYGREGFFSALAKAGGPDMVAHLDSLNPAQAKAFEGTLRKVQQYNLDQTGGDVQQAAHEFVAHFEKAGRSISDLTPQQLGKELKNWVNANESATTKFKDGRLSFGAEGDKLALKDGQRVIAARYNSVDHAHLMDLLKAAPDQAGRRAVIADQIKAGADWSKNPNVRSIIENAVSNKGDNYATDINKIVRSPSLFTAGDKNVHLGNGYFATVADNTRAGFKALKDTAQIDRGVAASGALGKVGSVLTKAGLDTRATDTTAVSKQIKANFANNLATAGVEGDAKKIYSALASVEKAGANDARFLSKRDVESALVGTATNADPAKVLGAMRKAYADLPTSMVGSGSKAVNWAIDKAPSLGTYMRLEQAGRYDSGLLSSPFRIKQFIKGSLVAAVEGRQFGVKASPEEIGMLRESGLLSKGAAGGDQGLSSTVGSGGQGTKLMNGEQEKILGGLAKSLANAHGTTIEALIKDKGELGKQFRQSMDLVHGYGHGGYMNSPLAKTLNFAIYPSRFDTKIAIEAGKALSKLPAAGQIGVAAGIANLSGFLGSEGGKKWQQDNASAIKLIQAFTPLQSIQNVSNFLGKGFHVGDLGQIGGLPIGVLGTILDHQGIDLGLLGTSQYTDPATGRPVANKIPQTEKARAQQAITDLVGSMFSYPGRTAGLNSKTNVIQAVIPGLKPKASEVSNQLKDGTVVPTAPRASKYTAPVAALKMGTVPAPRPEKITPVYKGSAIKKKYYGVRPTYIPK